MYLLKFQTKYNDNIALSKSVCIFAATIEASKTKVGVDRWGLGGGSHGGHGGGSHGGHGGGHGGGLTGGGGLVLSYINYFRRFFS